MRKTARGEDAMADEHYDAIVIGTSQGGRFLPLELAKAGHKVALVERDQLGGVCVNTGCTPTKTMVASARLAYQARRGAEYGVRIGPVSVDLAAVRERKRTMVAGARQNYASRLAQDGLDLIEGAARLIGSGDGAVWKGAAAILRDDGIPTLPSSTPARVEPADGGRLRLTVRTEDGERQLEGSHLLSAIGRIPNTEALTPEAAGIRLNDHGFIEVDEYLQTSVPGVYAMGDVKGGPAFTHLSYDDYRILHANLIRHAKPSTRDRMVPHTVFIDPQLGRVGMTEREARAQRRAIRVAKLPMSAVIRAIETGETRGFIKAVVDADSGQILGGAVLGREGGEIRTRIQVAMLGKLTYTAMADAIFTHPPLAEGLNTLFAMFDAYCKWVGHVNPSVHERLGLFGDYRVCYWAAPES